MGIPPDVCIEFIKRFYDPHDFAPQTRRICSNESQNVKDQGAMRSQQGTKPL